jgi:hypothetical protein
VKIPLDAKRNEASLKYLFTELVCSIAGGPETMTAPSLAETALSLSGADVVKLLGCVASAADHLDDKKHAVELAQLLHAHMGLMLAKPIDWSAAVAHGQEQLPIKDHAGMRDKVDSIARDLKVPLLYVPHGRSAFLLAMDDGAAAEPKAKRLKMTGALGFEEAAGGIAMLPQGSDKVGRPRTPLPVPPPPPGRCPGFSFGVLHRHRQSLTVHACTLSKPVRRRRTRLPLATPTPTAPTAPTAPTRLRTSSS